MKETNGSCKTFNEWFLRELGDELDHIVEENLRRDAKEVWDFQESRIHKLESEKNKLKIYLKVVIM